jgi:hypothetical protein
MCPYCGQGVYPTTTPEELTTAVATLPEPAGEPELVEPGGGRRRTTTTRS